ncbi:MAG: C10 family peptidase [Marinoscillum sp.]
MKKSNRLIVFSIMLILALLGKTYGQEAWPNETNGLIETEWDQVSPFNKHHPIDPISVDITVTGCNATAIGQLINFWGQKTGFPNNVSFLSSDSYNSKFDPGDGQGQREIYIDATTIGFENLDYTNLSEDNVAKIILASGVAINSKYSSDVTQANMDDIPKALERKFGFYQPQLIRNNIGFRDGIVRERVIEEIKVGRPVILQINSGGDNLFDDVVDGFSGQLSSHVVICDGYKVDEQGNELFHLNMGWGARTNIFGQETNDWFDIPNGMRYPYSNVLSAIVNIQNGIGINEAVHDGLTVNSKSEIRIEGVAPEDGEYYIGIWNGNGFSKPNWTWFNDYSSLSPSVGSYSVNLNKGQSFSIPFDLRPTSTSADLQVWLYKKDVVGFWPVQKIDHRLEAAIDDILP